VAVFSFCFAQAAQADELSDLKAQMKLMQKQMDEQKKQMETMQSKIEALETEKAVRIETPGEMAERVVALEEKLAKKGNLNVNWKDGLNFETDDKQFTMKIGGRLHMDSAWFNADSKLEDAVGTLKDDGETRRARFYMKGTIYEDYLYKLEYDWATGTASLKDAYLGLKNIPYLGTVKAGHQFEPFGLENMISTNYLNFIEFGLPEAFAPVRNIGITANSTAFDQKMTWATGLFRDADSQGNVTSNKYNWTSRLTFLPLYKDEGKKLLHLGLTYSFRSPEETLQYRSRPEANLAPYFVDSGTFAADRANLVAGEAAYVNGPFSLQGEYMGSAVERPDASDTYFQGAYIYASYFLTGEHRPYSKSAGVFSRLRPLKNFSPKGGGLGAWELALRYSYLDLNDENIDAGNMADVTLGLNWYLNPNMKIMWNYIYSHLNGIGNADMLLTRFQVDF